MPLKLRMLRPYLQSAGITGVSRDAQRHVYAILNFRRLKFRNKHSAVECLHNLGLILSTHICYKVIGRFFPDKVNREGRAGKRTAAGARKPYSQPPSPLQSVPFWPLQPTFLAVCVGDAYVNGPRCL